MAQSRILLADDDPQICALLRLILEPECQIVGSVADGEALLQHAHALQPDVIISDVRMPKLTGFAALPFLKRIAPDTRVIFLTSLGDPSDVDKAFAAGADGYLIKGVTQDLHGTLRETIQRVLKQTPGPTVAPSREQATPAHPGERHAH